MLNYLGLMPLNEYPNNRPLNAQELASPLLQNKRLEVCLYEQDATIRFNSTYIEIADKFYYDRGMFFPMHAGAVMVAAMLGVVVWTVLEAVFITHDEEVFKWLVGFIFLGSLSGAFLYFWYRCFCKPDLLSTTHFPIRFNRINKKVYVYGVDGTVKTYDWANLYFCLAHVARTKKYYDIRAYQLDKQGMITDAFSLTWSGDITNIDDVDDKMSHLGFWEFIRRYMEEGVQDSYNAVATLLPIAHKKERFTYSMWRAKRIIDLMATPILIKLPDTSHGEVSVPVKDTILEYMKKTGYILVGFFLWFFVLGRRLVVTVCKIPQWPAAVEAACVIAKDDAYNLEQYPKPKTQRTVGQRVWQGVQWTLYSVFSLWAYFIFFSFLGGAKGNDVSYWDFLYFWNYW